MSTYIVSESGVSKPNINWNGDLFKEISIRFADGQSAIWFTKETTPLPQPGSQLEGELVPDSRNPGVLKFKKAKQGGGSFGGGGSSNGPHLFRNPRRRSMTREENYFGMNEKEQEHDWEEEQWADWEKADTDVPFQQWRHECYTDAWDMREK